MVSTSYQNIYCEYFMIRLKHYLAAQISTLSTESMPWSQCVFLNAVIHGGYNTRFSHHIITIIRCQFLTKVLSLSVTPMMLQYLLMWFMCRPLHIWYIPRSLMWPTDELFGWVSGYKCFAFSSFYNVHVCEYYAIICKSTLILLWIICALIAGGITAFVKLIKQWHRHIHLKPRDISRCKVFTFTWGHKQE